MKGMNRHGSLNTCTLKAVCALIAVCLAGYILGPPLYWHLREGLTAVDHSSCPPCLCDCPSEPLLSITEGLVNASFTDCLKREPQENEDTERNIEEMMAEELKQKEATALESQQRADVALLEAKKLTSQYQKEADKCNSGMETCEEAREKAEAALEEQKRVTEMWELRARKRGWSEGLAKSQEDA